MKTIAIFTWTAAAIVALNGTLHSQNAPAKSPLEILQAMKTQNATLLEKQTATLLKLDEVAKAAQQIKILGKRS
jgi:hypothetical protein